MPYETIRKHVSERPKTRMAFARHLNGLYPDRSVKGWEMQILRFDQNPVVPPRNNPTPQTYVEPVAYDDWLLDQNYTYNQENDSYLTHLKAARGLVTVPGEVHRAMLSDYSGMVGEALTGREICNTYAFPYRWFGEYARTFNWTHGGDPFTDEEVGIHSEEELADMLIAKKRTAMIRNSERDEIKQLHNDAAAYRDLQNTLLGDFRNLITTKAGKPNRMKIDKAKNPYALVISPTDFHWGKHGWVDEVGEHYDFEEAKERLFTKTQQLVSRLHGRPDQIILSTGSDWFHVDTDNMTTTRGTPQDTCGTPAQILMTGCTLAREHIELLRQVAPIRVAFMPGNHDRHSAFALMMYLSAVYEDCDDVEILVSPKTRQYLKYGNTLLGFTHGDKMRGKDLPPLMATEARTLWGETESHIWFHGHLHHQSLIERDGCTIVQLPSLAGHDRYHHRAGYTRNKAGLAAHIIDKSEGLIGSLFAPVSHEE